VIGKGVFSRRQFLRDIAGTAVGIVGFPYIISSSALGRDGNVAPSNRITMGCIGIGMQGIWNLRSFIVEKDCQEVAVCDLDKNHLQDGANAVNEYYSNGDCAKYNDFRELLAREDIDAVSLALPDHWHAIPAIEAARSGKDIYGEKPLSHNLKEGRAICDTVNRYGRVWQTGSWQRSQQHFRFACELVRNGRIGKVHTVEIGLPSGHTDFARTKGQETLEPPPAELDYDFWLGPAPYEPYCVARVHRNWRWNLDYGGGQLMDWIGHHLDIAHWGLGLDYTGPIEIEGRGEFPKTWVWNSPTDFKLTAKYAGGLTMVISSKIRFPIGARWGEVTGTKWLGEYGWVCVTRGGIDAQPREILKERFGSNDIHLFQSPGHQRNFLDCVKSRQSTITPCEVAHRSVTPGHLGQIAMLLGRKIRFDPGTEQILEDDTATRLLGRSMRAPWHV
jgi:predicted dehydrogenase